MYIVASLTSTVVCCCVLFASGVVMEGDGPKPLLCTSELVLAVEWGLDAQSISVIVC